MIASDLAEVWPSGAKAADLLAEIPHAATWGSRPEQERRDLLVFLLEDAVDYPGSKPANLAAVQALLGTTAPRVRPVVVRFAEAMEAKLRANDHKPGWAGDDPGVLLDRLRDETAELDDSIRSLRRVEHVVEVGDARMQVRNEAADVANFAMFIADVCGGLATPERPALSREEVRPDHDARAHGCDVAAAVMTLVPIQGSGPDGIARGLAQAMASFMGAEPSPEHLVGAADHLRTIASELTGIAARRAGLDGRGHA